MKHVYWILLILFSASLSFAQKPDCNPGDPKGKPGCPDPKGNCKDDPKGKRKSIPVPRPKDPNEITGPAGYDSLRWVSSKQTLPYKVLFENDPKLATAPAQSVTIYVPIHAKLNPSSLRLSDFGFGRFNFTVPPNTSIFNRRLDLRDSLGLFVDVTAGLDVSNRRAFWIFQSIDPQTGLAATLLANAGFLPVNDSTRHNGEGYVNFTITPLALAQTRDTVSAKASIIFDTEDVITTNKWVNTIDAVAPTSRIGNLGAIVESVFDLSWTGQDDSNGSKVKDYVLYVSKNNGPFTIYKDKLTTTTEKLTGELGATYAFYTRAADNVGNIESDKSVGDRVVTVRGSGNAGVICPGASTVFAVSALTGATYQWQVSIGSGFVNITDNVSYTGTTGAQLTIRQAPETFYGYTYRCQITVGGNSIFSPLQKLTFASRWLGVAGESWHNPANWSCGIVPGATTNVIISSNVPANPVLNTNGVCRSLTMETQSKILLRQDVNLIFSGK